MKTTVFIILALFLAMIFIGNSTNDLQAANPGNGAKTYTGTVTAVGSPFECTVEDDGTLKERLCSHRGNVVFVVGDPVTYIIVTKGNGEESPPIQINIGKGNTKGG